MNDFDVFCSELLEEAKRFLEKAKMEKNEYGMIAYQHACLLLAVCSLEAYINGIAEEMCLAPKMPIHVKAFLLEKELRIENGDFIISNSLKMSRLIDRIEILYRRYSGDKLTDKKKWWITVKMGIDLRNKITHPKTETKITNELLEKILQAILACLTALYKLIYKRKFPRAKLQLTSKYDF